MREFSNGRGRVNLQFPIRHRSWHTSSLRCFDLINHPSHNLPSSPPLTPPPSPQAIGWIYGFVHQSFLQTFYIWACGLGVSVVLCVPDWPFFNRNPVKWLDKSGEKEGVVRCDKYVMFANSSLRSSLLAAPPPSPPLLAQSSKANQNPQKRPPNKLIKPQNKKQIVFKIKTLKSPLKS